MEVIQDNIYNYPAYYDLVYGSDWEAEYKFLNECIQKYCDQNPTLRLFEPACGTGRLMYRFAKDGFSISGLDLNQKAVDFCNARLKEHAFPESAFLADMSDFQVSEKFAFAFNTINSFRHLGSDTLAENHFRSMAEALTPNGIYVLGLHLTPTAGETLDEESWVAEQDGLQVNTQMYLTERNLPERSERYSMCFDVYTPERFFQIQDTLSFRTYTAEQMQDLIDRTGVFEIADVYDFSYNMNHTVEISPAIEDVIYILRRK